MALLKAIDARMKYVALMSGCGRPVGTPAHDSLLVDAMTAVLGSIRNCRSIPTDDAIQIKLLLDATLKPDQSNAVMDAVHLKVDAAGRTVEEPKQTHYFLDCYCTETLHVLFARTDQTYHTKLRFVAELMLAIKCVRCDEKTYALAVGLSCQTEPDADKLLGHVRHLKDIVKTAAGPSPEIGPLVYTRLISEFRQNYPALYNTAYAQDPPVESKWTDEHRNVVLTITPCRSSKQGCSSWKNSQRAAGTASMRSIMNFAQQAASSAAPSVPDIDMPGFRWSPPNQQGSTLCRQNAQHFSCIQLPGGFQLALPGQIDGTAGHSPSPSPAQSPGPSPAASPSPSPPESPAASPPESLWPPAEHATTKPLSMSELTKSIQAKVMGKADTADEAADGSDDDAPAKKRKKTAAEKKKPAKKKKQLLRRQKLVRSKHQLRKGGKRLRRKEGKKRLRKGEQRLRKKSALTTASSTAPPKTTTSLASMAKKPSTPIRSSKSGGSNQGKGVVTTRCSLSRWTLVRHGMTWSRH